MSSAAEVKVTYNCILMLMQYNIITVYYNPDALKYFKA